MSSRCTLSLRVLRCGIPVAALAALCSAPPALAQTPAPAVGLGFGVDTTAADVGPIIRLVRAYLAHPDSTARARGLWSTADSSDRAWGDLAARYALQGFPASIVGVIATDPGDSIYVVKLLHARAARAGAPVSPLALQRLYAVRAPQSPFGWQLAGALPRLTRDWRTHRAGVITFHYAPGQRVDPARAAHAARFVDSVATLFALHPPVRIDYFVTGSPDEYFRALGLDFFVLPSGRLTATGGNALPDVGVLLAGDPAQGEAYLHELVHVALGAGRVRAGFVNEGIAAWLGGSRGRSPAQLYRALVEYQGAHPGVTFAALVRNEVNGERDAAATTDAWYASGALVCEAVYRRSGVAGLRALADAPGEPDALLRALTRTLGLEGATALEHWWHSAASAVAR